MKQAAFPLVKLDTRDVPSLVALSQSVGWDYHAPEIETILSVGSIWGHKTPRGQVVSSSAYIPYGEQLASLGMVIVHPGYRGLSLGRAVTERWLAVRRESTPVMLIATPDGKRLYRHLGFETVSRVHKLLSDTRAPIFDRDPGPYRYLPLRPEHLTKVVAFDAPAFGTGREPFLRRRLAQAGNGVIARDESGRVAGYALSIQGSVHLLIGPVVAVDELVAIHLVERLVTGHRGPVRIDVPSDQTGLISGLVESGFRVAATPPVMVSDGASLPLRNGMLFAIAAQVFG